MSHINSIVQILEISPIEFYNNKIQLVKFRARLPSVRLKTKRPIIVQFIIWGNLAFDFVNYYRINDYILIEGSFSSILFKNEQPLITINIIKIYPFLFSFD
uniref:Ycf41 n=1 Tax=Thalassionema nitzschioides TaxID=33649 RepID=UPI001EDCB446|nr:Ycf41 [Thalassionema nitzschioides]UHY40744.1 Ycf41 [Thalassionema nitzschioides]